MLVELPLTIHNSHLLTSFLHQLPSSPTSADVTIPASLSELTSAHSKVDSKPLYPNFDSLDLSIDPYLEKSCDLLLDSIEAHQVISNPFCRSRTIFHHDFN